MVRKKVSPTVALWALMTTSGATIPSSHAFIFNAQAHPSLESASKISPGTAFDSRLDFDFNDARGGSNQLSIKGPTFEILDQVVLRSSIPLPTSDGASPSLSTGHKRIDVLADATFVGMEGLVTVPFQEGCWEMAWMSNQHEGQLACAFYVPFPIRRGTARITNGNVYFCFRVYSRESLAAGQEMKRRILCQIEEAMEEKEEHLEKMRSTDNPILKAFHYRNAFASFEKVLYAPEVSGIPETDEIIELPNGLLVVREGSMYRKGNGLVGPSWIKLGKVTVNPHLVPRALPVDLQTLKP